jgi:hypothetical protein
MNECFAACQSITVAHEGSCSTERSGASAPTAAAAAVDAADQITGVATAAAACECPPHAFALLLGCYWRLHVYILLAYLVHHYHCQYAVMPQPGKH